MQIKDIIELNMINRVKSGSDSINKAVNNRESFQQTLEKSISRSGLHDKHIKKTENKLQDKKLMDVCVQMESIFVSRMLKSMRNTIPRTKFMHGGFAEKIFEDMLYDEYALNLSKTANLGIADMLYKELR